VITPVYTLFNLPVRSSQITTQKYIHDTEVHPPPGLWPWAVLYFGLCGEI
jgi:hypothetical protein